MNYRFVDLVDIEAFGAMLKAFYEATGILHGLVDDQNNVISASGWREACTNFHRSHPCTRERCEESNRQLAASARGDGYVGARCGNGLMDYAAPIVVEGRVLATLYFGQVFHQLPDGEFFRRQAAECGFDEAAYLAAINKVPIVPEGNIEPIMNFYTGVAQLLARTGLDRLRLLEANEKLRQLSAQREKEREDERKRVGYELHEELGQYLTALRLHLSCLMAEAGEGNTAVLERGKHMGYLLEQTVSLARNLVKSMRPAVLNSGIAPALEWLGAEFFRTTGVPCEVVVAEGGIQLDEDRAMALFRIAEEALANIARHAKASQARIALHRGDGQCRLEVEDDGQGFDAASDRLRGLGLYGARERAAALGGRLEVCSQLGQGTQLTAILPTAQDEDAA